MLTAIALEALVPQRHSIRRIKPMVDRALVQLSPTFDRIYADHGRASIPPERLLKARLLMALGCGLRLGEVAELRRDHVGDSWLLVVDSDGHRPVTTPGVAGITRWAAIRVRQKVGRHTPPP